MPTNTVFDRFSYYLHPIANTEPFKSVSLITVYNFIKNNTLQQVTADVRSGSAGKNTDLPYITASGTFTGRKVSELQTYSGIVGIDLDDLDISIKSKIFRDPFLKPALIFVSPSKTGLKLFIRVLNADALYHNDYFNAISLWLFQQYGVESDARCNDIPRACYLCHDPEALFSYDGAVSSAELLEIFPPQYIKEKPLSPTEP